MIKGFSLISSADEIKKNLLKEYNKDPKDWQHFVAKDSFGHLDSFFMHKKRVFLIKEEIINPVKSIGFGIKEDTDKMELPNKAISFGLRPIQENMLEQLANMNITKKNNILNSLLNQRPIPSTAIKSPAIIHGPINFSRNPLNNIWNGHKEADSLLRDRLEEQLNRKYPHLRTIYG